MILSEPLQSKVTDLRFLQNLDGLEVLNSSHSRNDGGSLILGTSEGCPQLEIPREGHELPTTSVLCIHYPKFFYMATFLDGLM